MADPQYRARLQRLADFLVAVLPKTWDTAAVRVSFPSKVGTDMEVWYRPTATAEDEWLEIPTPMCRDFAYAARDVRDELVRAGNSKCAGFVFRLTSAGKSSLDIEYESRGF